MWSLATYSLENRRKIEPKEIPSCLILPLLVVFTRQLKILVITLEKGRIRMGEERKGMIKEGLAVGKKEQTNSTLELHLVVCIRVAPGQCTLIDSYNELVI